MPLNITPTALHAPGYCSASGSLTGPFIQTGTAIRGVRVQISVPWVLGIAADLGLVPASELHDAVEDAAAANETARALADRVERFDEDVANVAEALVSFLAVVRVRDGMVGELKAAREAVGVLTERVAALEAPDPA